MKIKLLLIFSTIFHIYSFRVDEYLLHFIYDYSARSEQLDDIEQELLMVRKPQPVVISLGCNCDVADMLNRCSLRNQAFPFDWNLSSFDAIYSLFADDFAHFLDKEDLVISENKAHVVNTKTGIIFVHDFPVVRFAGEGQSDSFHIGRIASNFLDAYQTIYDKYHRRVERLYNMINSGAKIYFIRSGDITKKQAEEFYTLLQQKFQSSVIELIVINSPDELKKYWNIPHIHNYYEPAWTDYNKHIQWWKNLFINLGLLNR